MHPKCVPLAHSLARSLTHSFRHLGVRPQFLPNSRGFNYYLGIPFSADMGTSVWHPEPANNFDWAPQPLVEGTDTGGWSIIEQPAAMQNLTVRYAEAASKFITESSKAGDPPWVLYVAFNHVHNPQYCNAQWCGTASGVVGSGPAIPSGHGGTGSAVQEMDWTVGEIMAALKTAGVDDNTVVFFTSDNGAPSNHIAVQDERGSNAPLKGYKGSVWEGGIRMPAMVRWPGKVRPGSVSTELVATYDIFVTMAAMAGTPLPAGRV
jgi:arylsulfatase A